MEKIATLSEEDRKELVKLYREARTTPVIGFSVKQMIEGEDLASQAWNRLRKKLDELGEKYGYDPKKVQINQETGEVFSLNPYFLGENYGKEKAT